jgi:hypothetical protein
VALKEHKHTIDGIEYTTRTFPATQALTLGARIARLVVVESWQALLSLDWDKFSDAFGGEGESEDTETMRFAMVLADGFVSAAKMVEPEEFASLCKELLVNTDCSNIADSGAAGPVKTHFDTHFAGRLGHLGKVVFWVAHKGFTRP